MKTLNYISEDISDEKYESFIEYKPKTLKLLHEKFGFSQVPAYKDIDPKKKQLYAFVNIFKDKVFKDVLHYIDKSGEPECQVDFEYKIQGIKDEK